MANQDESAAPQAAPGRQLWLASAGAAAIAIVLLVIAILPAEYGVDPTGLGGALGLTAMSTAGNRTLEIADVLGGNEAVRTVEIPDYGQPVPLPNPEIHQSEMAPPQTRTMTVSIPAEQETEIKTVLREGKVIVYSWSVDRGILYSDFHGHDPEVSAEFWVRYEEHQEGAASANGSLVAPFGGEHGWYWVNLNEHPVTVTLTVTGYFDDIIDYGIF